MRPLKVVVISPGIGKSAGGLQGSICGFSRALAQKNCNVHVIAPQTSDAAEALPDWKPLNPTLVDVRWHGLAAGWGKISEALDRIRPDLVHFNSLWLPLSFFSHQWCKRNKRPYLLAPHGILNPNALARSRLKKRLALLLYERSHLREAACLHALCAPELESFRAFGLKNPACVVPNGIDIPPAASGVSAPPPWDGVFHGKKILLFLGRINPGKGLALLINAWAVAKRESPQLSSQWALVIGGWDQFSHQAELARLVNARALVNDVLFTGPLFGEAKASALRRCDAFALPSFNEGLPMSVLEAWSYGKPTLLSRPCNLPEGFKAGAALPLELTAEQIARQLGALADLSSDELAAMGDRALALANEKFTWPRVADELVAVYQWMVGRDKPPATVYFS